MCHPSCWAGKENPGGVFKGASMVKLEPFLKGTKEKNQDLVLVVGLYTRRHVGSLP